MTSTATEDMVDMASDSAEATDSVDTDSETAEITTEASALRSSLDNLFDQEMLQPIKQ